MSDFVKRLKARYHIHNGEPDKDCHEAAAEIERLTTALSTALSTARREIIKAAAEIAYLQCLRSGNKKRRTKNLGLGRETYNTEYASECKAAILSLMEQPVKDGRAHD